MSAGADETFVQVERPVVVGELISGLEVANRDFEVIAGAQAAGLAAVVHEPCVVPAEDGVTPAVQVAEF